MPSVIKTYPACHGRDGQGNVQGLEIIVVQLNLRPFYYLETHTYEESLNLVQDLSKRMLAAPRGLPVQAR